MWVEVFQVGGEGLNKRSNHLIKQLTLQTITIVNHFGDPELLQLHIATDRREEMIPPCVRIDVASQVESLCEPPGDEVGQR